MRSLHDPRYIELIARLRKLRRSKNLSQRELARRMGKPQSFVSKIETGERRIDLIETLSLCESLGVTLEAVIPPQLHRLIFRLPTGKRPLEKSHE
jgi:transcriptional regulator with XRE-family HTH domain